MVKAIEVNRLISVLGDDVMGVSGPLDRAITHPASIYQAGTEEALTFCTADGKAAEELIRTTRAGVVVCSSAQPMDDLAETGKTLIAVKRPRLSFLRLLNAFFDQPKPRGIHPTAVVDSDAEIDPEAYIGPFAYVGKCQIGPGTVVYGHTHIYGGNVRIGKNVVIDAGAIIGTDGLGYERNEKGEFEYFPSLGGLIVEDDVEIRSGVVVCRGALEDTMIGRGTKIDKLAMIGREVVIGNHCFVASQCTVAGRTVIGDYSWISMQACIRDGGIKIGAQAFVGMAAVVTKDVPDGAAVMGAPAYPMDDFKKILKAVKNVAEVE